MEYTFRLPVGKINEAVEWALDNSKTDVEAATDALARAALLQGWAAYLDAADGMLWTCMQAVGSSEKVDDGW